MKIIKFMEDHLNSLTTKISASSKKKRYTKILIVTFLLLIFLTFYLCAFIYSNIYDSSYYIDNDPDIAKLALRFSNCDYVNNKISFYKSVKKVYPGNIGEIIQYSNREYLIDPLTNDIDWEVCDSKKQDIWYRTTFKPYDPLLPLWNTDSPFGIHKVRPRKVTEEIEIKKRWNSYLGYEKYK